jgi:hypothetical protein
VLGARERSREGNGTAFGRSTQPRELIEVTVRDRNERPNRRKQVTSLHILKLLEHRLPFACMIKPSFPLRVESIFGCRGKTPQGYAIRWIKYFLATLCRDSKYGARLREIMRSRKSSSQSRGAQSTELSSGVPPFGKIHLAESTNYQPKLQEPVEVD